ncbi:hypothetical protein GALMADRAFT_1343825 [Galerina marginata CBS 339.88]|uniref:Uncharacterized protein n=1 Tax=Galerina marginata (strain CBS 339.88) TaxID=685588 RepID=A0A067SX26_GALM3|nr:hypothetical protein GALMADRAFT_1343825 [Galerina marginata CBS 339.88]
MPSSTPLPEDILRLIAEQIVQHGESLQGLALSSRVHMIVCRSDATADFDIFGRALERSPEIVDHDDDCHTRADISTHPYCLRGSQAGLEQATIYFMGRVLQRLTSVRHLQLSLFHLCPDPPILTTAIGEVLKSPYIQRVHLHGWKNLTYSIAQSLLHVEELFIAHCSFTCDYGHAIDPKTSTSLCSLPYTVKRLHYAPLNKTLPLVNTIANHWSTLDFPRIEELSLVITSFPAVTEAAMVLLKFKHGIRTLTVDTTKLKSSQFREQLLRHIPRNSHIGDIHVFRVESDHTPDACFLGGISSREMNAFNRTFSRLLGEDDTGRDGWFSLAMSELSFKGTFPLLENLALSVTYWPNCSHAEDNGEINWVGNVLEDVNYETARRLQDIQVTVHVGTEYCVENVQTIFEMKDHEGWFIWDHALSNPKWESLQTFTILVRSSIKCIPEAKEACEEEVSDFKDRFPILWKRGVLRISCEFITG